MRIYRASSIGASCLRGLVAEQLGEKPIPFDAASELRMREGNLHEGDVVDQLTAEGSTITRQQEEVNLFTPAHVQGHLDGVIDDGFQHRVLEVKSMGKTAFAEFKAVGWDAPGLISKYKWQLSVYMLATGLEGLLVAKSRDSGELLRFGVEVPFHSLDEIAERVAFLEEWVERGELPPDCPRDWFCNYKYLCDRTASEDTTERSPAPVLIQQYVELGETIRGLEAQREVIKAELPALLGDAASITWDGYKATRVTQNRKERVVPASTVSFIKVTKESE